jgi:formylglycine-generating enzyme required for sulfatase activity/pimeloyl-ACP methyl ester carboxylesterase
MSRDSVGQTSDATQRCLHPGSSERMGNPRRTGHARTRVTGFTMTPLRGPDVGPCRLNLKSVKLRLPVMVGQIVSHYRIVEKLGGGGMGVVYKAIDTRLNRFVALKFLSPALTKDAEANARFMQEAQSASALDHPNICTIYEIDETPERELFLTMAYYDGETLKQRIERGPLSIEDAVDIATQLAQALSQAHQSGIVHRDIKPANVMLTKDGLSKIVDFGLAKLVGHSDLTRTGTTLGTIAYMSPEQIRGMDIDARADVWSLGVVLYEMLAGRRPFEGKDDLAVISSIANDTPTPTAAIRPDVPAGLSQVLSRALARNLASRYASATELLKDLTACRVSMTTTPPAGMDVVRLLRRPVIAIPVAVIVIAVGVLATLAYRRASRARWAREEGVPHIMQLVAKDDYAGAFAVAKEVEHYSPNDPVLASLWPQFSAAVSITTTPVGAEVAVQDYATTDDHWNHMGRTPVHGIKLPRGVFRFRIEKEGFEPQTLATTNPGNVLQNAFYRLNNPISISLLPRGTTPEMVPVPGGSFPVSLKGIKADQVIRLDPFSIDRYEVTNGAFKTFVDRGGYGNPDFWRGLSFVMDGRELAWPEAARQFQDSTGRPGPATWELGEYPSEQGTYPVGGVSWYEAVAYCRSEGKMLPTVSHWARAALSPAELFAPLAPAIIPLSNFGGKGPAQVGSFRGVGPYGTYDMAGNVREWSWNESGDGGRWILGGAWSDPVYLFVEPPSLPPFDRSATNGFRCARYRSDTARPDPLLARAERYSRNHRTASAVSDEVFDVFKRQFSRVKSALNPRVESSDASGKDWIRDKISFDAGYDKSRVSAYLFLPRNAKPPYQLVIYFPGASSFVGRTSSDALQPGGYVELHAGGYLDFILKSGRALVWPVYEGSYERWDPLLSLQGEEYLQAFRTRMLHWRYDLGNTLDVLSARGDIDIGNIAYAGLSFGASLPLPLLALESRLKVAVLIASGFWYREVPPEADAINYVSRVTMPVLMLGGRYDYVFPLETSQMPLFDRFGTPADRKRHVVVGSGHMDFPRSELIREVLGWLDSYLGPVKTTAPSQTQQD